MTVIYLNDFKIVIIKIWGRKIYDDYIVNWCLVWYMDEKYHTYSGKVGQKHNVTARDKG